MKKTPLIRKTALKQKSVIKPKSSLARCGISSASSARKTRDDQGTKKTIHKSSSRGLSGHGRSVAHIKHHEDVVNTGCFACNFLGVAPVTRLCVHHPRGRNKGRGDTSEWFVMCLCYAHHDPSTMAGGDMLLPSVHGNKKLFMRLIGTEIWCVHETYRQLDRCPIWMGDDKWLDYLSLNTYEDQNNWLTLFIKESAGFHEYC